MGKKRFNSAILTKTYASSSSSLSHVSQASTKHELSVTDKLLQLRLEGIKHERNSSGAHVVPTSIVPPVGIHVDSEVSELLGHEYITPRSRQVLRYRTRLESRSPGHLAPKSWTRAPRNARQSTSISRRQLNRRPGVPTLVSLCLERIALQIDDYLECGLEYVPGHMKSVLLSSLDPESSNEAIWLDIVPLSEEADDTIEWLDISRTNVPTSTLRRLSGLRQVKCSIAQLHSGLIFHLPSVLYELAFGLDGPARSGFLASRLQWRKLATHFVALRHMIFDFRGLRDDEDLKESLSLLETLRLGPDWHSGLDTLTQISVVTNHGNDPMRESLLAAVTALRDRLKAQRRRGKHIDCHFTVKYPEQQISNFLDRY